MARKRLSEQQKELIALIPQAIRDSKHFTNAAKLVLAQLDLQDGTDFSESNHYVFSSNEGLMKNTGISSEHTVIDAVKKLIDEGLIETRRGYRRKGDKKASEYILTDKYYELAGRKNPHKKLLQPMYCNYENKGCNKGCNYEMQPMYCNYEKKGCNNSETSIMEKLDIILQRISELEEKIDEMKAAIIYPENKKNCSTDTDTENIINNTCSSSTCTGNSCARDGEDEPVGNGNVATSDGIIDDVFFNEKNEPVGSGDVTIPEGGINDFFLKEEKEPIGMDNVTTSDTSQGGTEGRTSGEGNLSGKPQTSDRKVSTNPQGVSKNPSPRNCAAPPSPQTTSLEELERQEADMMREVSEMPHFGERIGENQSSGECANQHFGECLEKHKNLKKKVYKSKDEVKTGAMLSEMEENLKSMREHPNPTYKQRRLMNELGEQIEELRKSKEKHLNSLKEDNTETLGQVMRKAEKNVNEVLCSQTSEEAEAKYNEALELIRKGSKKGGSENDIIMLTETLNENMKYYRN